MKPLADVEKKDLKAGRRLVKGLPPSLEGTARARAFRDEVAKSHRSLRALDATIQAYRLAGAGIWKIDSMHDILMLISATEENAAILPEIEEEIERVLRRFEPPNGPFHGTWKYIRKKLLRPPTNGQAA